MEKETDEEFLERLKIGNRAVKKAQELNWEKGLPNVYSKNKKYIMNIRRRPIRKGMRIGIADGMTNSLASVYKHRFV